MHIDLQSLHIIINITLMKIANLALTWCKMHRFQCCIFSKHVEIVKFQDFLKMLVFGWTLRGLTNGFL